MSNGHHNENQKECPLAPESVDMQELKGLVKMAILDIGEIKIAITGNTKLGIQGLVKRLDSNENDIAALKKWRDNINLKVAYTSGIVSGITFGGLEGLKALIESLKHHTP